MNTILHFQKVTCYILFSKKTVYKMGEVLVIIRLNSRINYIGKKKYLI